MKNMMKIFSGVIISSFFAFSSSFAFTDVNSGSIFSESIQYAQENGIVNGYNDGSFQPQKEINRAEFTKIILESIFDESEIYGENCFPDVTTQWFAKYICTAQRKGIVKGYANGNFGPADEISFVESAKIITLANGENIQENNSVNWFAPYVEKLSEKKAIPATIQQLDKKIQRGEMVEIIWRIKENKTDRANSIFQNNNLEIEKEIACTREYMPVCGIKDTGIRCITSPCPSSEEKTFGNQCMLENSDFKFLHKGECTISTPTPTPYDETCVSVSPVCAGGSSECFTSNGTTICTSPLPRLIFPNKCAAKQAGHTVFYDINSCGENPYSTPTPTNICPVYDLSPNFCANGKIGSKKDDNGCDMPICIENNEKTLQEKIEEVAITENKKLCNQNTVNQETFIFSAFPVYSCENSIGVFPPMGLADAPNKYYEENGEMFFCGGYQIEGSPQDARCYNIGECKQTDFYLCPLNASTPIPTPAPTQKTCSMQYDPVCGQPLMPSCEEGTLCSQVMPAPKTYSNICFMENAGASFLYSGQCKNEY